MDDDYPEDTTCDVCGDTHTGADPLIEWSEGLAHEACGYEMEWRQA